MQAASTIRSMPAGSVIKGAFGQLKRATCRHSAHEWVAPPLQGSAAKQHRRPELPDRLNAATTTAEGMAQPAPEVEVASPNYFVWGAILLAVTGGFTAVIRYLLPHDLHMFVVTLLLGAYGPEQLPVLASYPITEALHRVGGVLYLVLGFSQFSTGIRDNYRKLHRWFGRVFLATTLAIGASGAYIAVKFPYAANEALPSVVFSAVMVACGFVSYLRIRANDIQGHKEWAARSFATGLAVGLLRIMLIVLIKVTPFHPRELMAPTMWVSWVAMLLLSEMWIRSERENATSAA